MPQRDEFTKPTKEKLARKVGFTCSICYEPTVGPTENGEGTVSIGEAAHITAAAPGGPRYDATLTSEERAGEKNGIWCCANHAKEIDSDPLRYTVPALKEHKRNAERAAFERMSRGHGAWPTISDTKALIADWLRQWNLLEAGVSTLDARIHAAAKTDIASFKALPEWPEHAVNLTLSSQSASQPFEVAACARAIRASPELIIVAPPGTGKSTTAIQLAESILEDDARTAIYVSLNEWSIGQESILESLRHRAAFRDFLERDFIFLAIQGALTLILDGWNELDSTSRRRATVEVKRLRRDCPLIEIVITTRRQALDVPLGGVPVEIEPLSTDQQMELARSTAGDAGATLVDRAWRISSLRELVAIPLYLKALLANAPEGRLPTTREEVLRIFVTQHERSAEDAEILRQALDGFHPQVLEVLAVEAIATGATAIAKPRANFIVSQVTQTLHCQGQIGEWRPRDVLDVLINHHTLVLYPGEGGISFQHQQIQEWYGSAAVEKVLRDAEAGDTSARQRLRDQYLNLPVWEESLLFACERVSRADTSGVTAVSMCIFEALTIDPLLAAQIIYRSAPQAWAAARQSVLAFVDQWHAPGTVDRAVTFMITSGQGDFSSYLWPLLSNPDDQLAYPALRAAPRFRPGVLGPDAAATLRRLPERLRARALTEIASNSDVDGMELAAEVARLDESAKIKVSVIESLQFRHSGRLVRQVLTDAPDAVWQKLAVEGYEDEITDPDLLVRLRSARERAFAQDSNPSRLVDRWLRMARSAEAADAIARAFESAEFANTPDTGWSLGRAFELYPEEVSRAIQTRFRAGGDMPPGSESILLRCQTTDERWLADRILEEPASQATSVAMVMVGPAIIRAVIEKLLTLHERSVGDMEPLSQEDWNEHHRLVDLLALTRLGDFSQAFLGAAATQDPARIALLADVFARHGRHVNEEEVFVLPEALRSELAAVLVRWIGVLLSAPGADRHQFGEVARMVTRVATADLADPLVALLAEDLARLRRARQISLTPPLHDQTAAANDARRSYALQYQRAFVAIGTDHVQDLIRRYLRDPEFAAYAAGALKEILDAQAGHRERSSPSSHPIDFSRAAERGAERARGIERSSVAGEAILDAASELLEAGATERGDVPLILAIVGFSLPHRDRPALVEALLSKNFPSSALWKLLASLALDGVVIPSNAVLQGLKARLEAHAWNSQDRWELEIWPSLLLYSDCPDALLEALDLVGTRSGPLHLLRQLISALGHAPVSNFKALWAALLHRDPVLLNDHGWLSSLLDVNNPVRCLLLLDFLSDSSIPKDLNGFPTWWAADLLAKCIRQNPEVRRECLRRYEDPGQATSHGLLEESLARCPDLASVLTIVRRYGLTQRPHDGRIESMMEEMSLEKRVVTEVKGAYQLHSIDASPLRRQLFALTQPGRLEATIAEACLITIDRLRDRHGRPPEEARHPDISTGRPWPLTAPRR